MRRATPLLLLLALATACAPTDGLLARYHMEQKMWRAQFYQRRIKISFLRASRHDMQMAIAAFRDVLGSDPTATPAAAAWDAVVREDIRNMMVVSRIALANLYFLSERYADAGTLYQQTLELGDLSLDRSLEARLGAARSLYLSGETSEVMALCAEIFRELAQNPVFQTGENEVDPVFMNVPVALVRMYVEAGDTSRTQEFSRLALDFYDGQAGRPGAAESALDARLGALQVCLAVRAWPEAVSRLQAILDDPGLAPDARPGLELLLGEIFAFPMGDEARAGAILQRVVDQYPGSGYDFAAAYDLGSLRASQGDSAGAEAIFRAIETDNGAPAAVASRAMFARARLIEARGNWDEAYVIYRRVFQLYPNTMAAIEAPLVVTRHFVASGEVALARRTLEGAREYYMALLDRGSPFAGDRLVVQAALAESFTTAGDAAGVAELLGSGSPNWDEASSAAGMLRSAELYETVLGEPQMAAEMLKKCVERFPETRYANVAQRRLDELEGRSP
ncbi:MAG: tetratricopeptide repeat protein [Candidatus Krumholzibacteria bacterium]|nr:tetratricopeptide repeat protein [Candidatus Krumholzibacteria bacterium]MDH4336477.1 tetratricopeptide repeat protein [Candidatus Krumholzibacteria bacterium]MDH5269069.1 tetratricopeptide repeat protein [Candidatus Krumholzibacteria bacterium]MDH5627029.1 tetratricopeptide repeat protein [Candidatus Krumholzibacteria bacterium]